MCLRCHTFWPVDPDLTAEEIVQRDLSRFAAASDESTRASEHRADRVPEGDEDDLPALVRFMRDGI